MTRLIPLCLLLCSCTSPGQGENGPQSHSGEPGAATAGQPGAAGEGGAGGASGASGAAGAAGSEVAPAEPDPTQAAAGASGAVAGSVSATGTIRDASDEATPAPSSCTVVDNDDGTATISCPDGTSVTVSDGAPGEQGEPGTSGTPGSDAPAAYQGGDRITVQWLIGDDGSRVFSSFYDTELEHTCGWISASDGVTRCLPIIGDDVAPVINYFADADCQVALASFALDATTEPRWGVAAYRVIFDIAGEYTGTSALYQGGSTGGCIPLSEAVIAATFATRSLWLLGDEVPPATFVGATLVTEGL